MNSTLPGRARICPGYPARSHRRDARTLTRTRDPQSQSPETAPPRLTARQLAAMRAVMRLFVENDLADGVSKRYRLHCDACARPRPMPGFVKYEDRRFCNDCATDYEIARLSGLARSAGEFQTKRAAV